MKSVFAFVNKTIKGGVFFLIPVALIIILFNKILQFFKPLAQRISLLLDPDNKATFDLSYTIAILMLILLCFCFGLIGSLRSGKLFIRWIEQNILIVIPGYTFMKSSAQAAAGMEETMNFPVVLIPQGGWAIAFLIERLENNVVVFIPGAPNPWSGRVLIFKESEVRETTMTQIEAIRFLKYTGIGLKDVKLKDGKKLDNL